MACRMNEKAGMQDKAKEIRDGQDRRRKSFLENLGIVTSFIIIFISLIILSFSLTGFVVSENFIYVEYLLLLY
jgi:cytochrome c biogenesis protein CcdA